MLFNARKSCDLHNPDKPLYGINITQEALSSIIQQEVV